MSKALKQKLAHEDELDKKRLLNKEQPPKEKHYKGRSFKADLIQGRLCRIHNSSAQVGKLKP